MSAVSIHPNTSVGAVYLTVSDLDRALRFYGDVLGFSLLRRGADTAILTADGQTPLLDLAGRPGAQPKPPHTTGLYHFAILVPSRADLGRSLRHLAEMDYPLQGAADHLVSEALYLADPDGNGIEIYRDRPRDAWPQRDGRLYMSNEPLNFGGLLAEAAGDGRPWEGLHPHTRIGHIHLHVSDLRQAEAFYHEVLGFAIMTRYGTSASFLSAGGYHHHIGINVWAGVGAPPPPADAAGLRWFAIRLSDEPALAQVVERLQRAGVPYEERDTSVALRDPSGNGIGLKVNSHRQPLPAAP
jgi:catechol 2,3-dioxygenase